MSCKSVWWGKKYLRPPHLHYHLNHLSVSLLGDLGLRTEKMEEKDNSRIYKTEEKIVNIKFPRTFQEKHLGDEVQVLLFVLEKEFSSKIFRLKECFYFRLYKQVISKANMHSIN